jgi:hypothetical protein
VRIFPSAILLLALAGCAPESSNPVVGDASGSFDCEIFLPGSSPPNTGDGAVVVTLDGRERILAQSAAAFAVDGAGNQTLDPEQASFFAVQVLQYVSEQELEVFEVRVLPADWVAGTEIPFDGVTAVGFYGKVEFDANGNAVDARVKASTTGGSLLLGDAGRDPRAAVTGALVDLRLAAE